LSFFDNPEKAWFFTPFFNRRRSSAVLFVSQVQHNADYAVYHVKRIPAKAVENAVFLAKLKENSSTKILKQFGRENQ